MKKWTGLLIAIVCIFTTPLRADNAQTEIVPATSTESQPPTPISTTAEQAPKQVGKASTDGTNTAQASMTGRYIFAATAVAVGITALILVSRHNGHK